MKKLVIGLVLAAVVAALTGCRNTDEYPFVKIERDNTYSNDIIIPIGRGYILTKQVYTIEEHKDGYDIIIHVKAGVCE